MQGFKSCAWRDWEPKIKKTRAPKVRTYSLKKGELTIHLKTADDVRLELGKVYRDMRQGRIDMADGTKLAYVLGQLNKAIETGVIEARLEMMEHTLKQRKIKND